jgi:hypothetical protein
MNDGRLIIGVISESDTRHRPTSRPQRLAPIAPPCGPFHRVGRPCRAPDYALFVDGQLPRPRVFKSCLDNPRIEFPPGLFLVERAPLIPSPSLPITVPMPNVTISERMTLIGLCGVVRCCAVSMAASDVRADAESYCRPLRVSCSMTASAAVTERMRPSSRGVTMWPSSVS